VRTIVDGQRIGYIRVSSFDQNPERQREHSDVARVFTDTASGKDAHRPELEALLGFVRQGDTVVVHSMDRLARNLDDLRRVVRTLTGKGVRVEFVKESLTFTGEDSPMATLLLSVMGAFAEFERALILERQRDGIAAAKQRGVYTGRKPALTPEQAVELRARAAAGEKKAALARHYRINRDTVYTYLNATPDLPADTRPAPDLAGYDQLLDHTTPATVPAAEPAIETTPAPAEPSARATTSPATKAPRRRPRKSWEQRMRSSEVESVRELVDIARPDESGVRRVTDHDGTSLGRVARETRLGGGRGRWIAWYDTGTRLPGRGWDTLEKAVVGLLLAIDDRAAMSAERAKRDRKARAGDKL
jgi:DNA invertase Pin-like site-specific DNA recombinase